LIILDHANGYSSYYGHLSQLYVAVGQQVGRGQVIGAVGSTGNSTGPHLHLEIRYNGSEQNPFVFLP
jgi:murein DD-endopeptidase MepM/ murein hydrolase activator NlpD